MSPQPLRRHRVELETDGDLSRALEDDDVQEALADQGIAVDDVTPDRVKP